MASPKSAGVGGAEIRAGIQHLGQEAVGDVQELQDIVVPAPLPDVVEQRARRVGGVGDMALAARELPDQPAVDRAEGELAGLGPLARAVHIVEEPGELGAREIRVEQKARLLLHHRLMAVAAQRSRHRGGAPILPDDGVVHRRAGVAVPKHDRLALVRDADGGDRTRRLLPGFAHGGERGGPDHLRVVFHPARSGIDLREFLLRGGDGHHVSVEHDGPCRCGALVDRQNLCHRASPSPSGPRPYRAVSRGQATPPYAPGARPP
jgi:hypothetical protein